MTGVNDMRFLYFLEGLRMPGLNEFMLAITQLGDEMAFLVIALVLFWCIDKKVGYYILSIGLFGTLANQFMKLYFRVPRPWLLDENFTILEQAREGASGYSFPSGHTQSAVSTFGGLAYVAKNRWAKIVLIAVAVLVPFSRMYIGVHTPLDVAVAALMALILIFVLRPLILENDRKYMPAVFAVMIVFAIAYVCYVAFYPFPANIDLENLASGTKNAYTLLGALLGFLVVYIADEKWLHFSTKAVWWAQIVKVLLGLMLILVIKSGLKAPLHSAIGANAGDAVRYFVIVLAAGILWPLTFRWFGKLGKKA